MKKLLKLLCPSEFVESVLLIDIAVLKKRGIQALLIDLDNTLVPWRGYDIAPEVVDWLHEAEKHGMKVCIVSNTRVPKRLRRLAGEFILTLTRWHGAISTIHRNTTGTA